VDELKYQKNSMEKDKTSQGELMTVKFRYKRPDGNKSTKLEYTVGADSEELKAPSEDYRFAAAVASFGMLLNDSKYKGGATYDSVASEAEGARGKDKRGYRGEFVRLIETARDLSKTAHLQL
jgi:Ca-activated chloride channel family protein